MCIAFTPQKLFAFDHERAARKACGKHEPPARHSIDAVRNLVPEDPSQSLFAKSAPSSQVSQSLVSREYRGGRTEQKQRARETQWLQRAQQIASPRADIPIPKEQQIQRQTPQQALCIWQTADPKWHQATLHIQPQHPRLPEASEEAQDQVDRMVQPGQAKSLGP